jgi:hypothetical protein
MSSVPVFSLIQNKARKLALSTMGFVWHINSSTMHMIRECNVYRDKCTYMNFDTSLTPSGTSNLNLLQNPNFQDISSNLLQKILFLLKMQRPVSITRELPRGSGLDFNSQKKHELKKRQTNT